MATPLLLIDGIQDDPRKASKAAKRTPREPQERPKRALREAQEDPRGSQHVPQRALRWPQEAYKTLPERTTEKVLILTTVVDVFALFFLVAVPFCRRRAGLAGDREARGKGRFGKMGKREDSSRNCGL